MKIIAGECALACVNNSRTLLAPTPTYNSSNSEPDIKKNGTPASPAVALANKVLPVPGGPVNKTPFGNLPPKPVNFVGSFKKSTISSNSALASSAPRTSSNLTVTLDISTDLSATSEPLKIVPDSTK